MKTLRALTTCGCPAVMMLFRLRDSVKFLPLPFVPMERTMRPMRWLACRNSLRCSALFENLPIHRAKSTCVWCSNANISYIRVIYSYINRVWIGNITYPCMSASGRLLLMFLIFIMSNDVMCARWAMALLLLLLLHTYHTYHKYPNQNYIYFCGGVCACFARGCRCMRHAWPLCVFPNGNIHITTHVLYAIF